MTIQTRTISSEQVRQFNEDGYVIVPGLLRLREVEELKSTFDALHSHARCVGGSIPGCFTIGTPEEIAADPLKLYPRMMHPHRVDEVAMRYMLHSGTMDALDELFGEPAIAAQSMFYWKPPGARGQAFHQDNFYLRVQPGNCLAAWIAVDVANETNGGLVVAPGSHRLDVLCPNEADPDISFTRHFVPVPAGLPEVPVALDPGDVLFFGGNLIHGSHPNGSDRFRRAFICHYIPRSAVEVSRFYKPLYDRQGQVVGDIGDAPTDGGPCGVEPAVKSPH